MRVIAGRAKGRKLLSVPGEATRPITDRVKEALFDILSPFILGSVVLDLFAGTGGVGIEALSRGAARAVFVDSDRRAIRTVRKNLELTGLGEWAEVRRADAFQFISGWKGAPFDLIYVAPPQYHGLWAKALRKLDARPLAKDDGLVATQIHPKEYEPLSLERHVLVDRRRYGSTELCFYERREGPLA
jgi:16S rRNA (guanine966-N2)-methyltransferase